ncbi:hypothetical protein J6590_028750 [Homalodisca vitripennis]|nr:hypothetical protein J6590_028750 [Homalodisca vitripennis]
MLDYLDVKRSLVAQWTDVAARMRGPARSPSSAVSSICSTSEVSISYPGMSGKQLRLKVADACGKSSSTVYRVLKESENSPGETKKFTTPHKRRPRKKGKE